MSLYKYYGLFIMTNTSKPHYMKKNLFSLLSRLMLLFVLATAVQQASAQYLFSQQFANPGVLSTTGWQVYSPKGATFRDTVNGFAQPGIGSVHVSFTDLRSGDIDTLTLPIFTATAANDSVLFDHAHRAKNIGADSMAIWYSTNGGVTYNYLSSYAGNNTPSATTLSTVFPSMIPGRFRPSSAAMWAHKGAALPVGTNRIQFIFYSDGGDELFLDNIFIGKDALGCTSAPPVAVLPVSVAACAGNPLIISPASLVFNPYATYQWEKSLDSGVTDPWATVANAGGINAPDFFLNSFSQTAYYRLVIICGAGGTSTSAGSYITFDSSYNCYCRTNLGGWCNAWITEVSISGTDLSNFSTCNDTDPGNKFTFFPPSANTTDTLTAGQPFVTLNIGTDLFGSWLSGKVGYWIDFDKNGTFDSLEFTLVNDNFATGTYSNTFTVPVTAVAGYTGLRVRTIEGNLTPFDGSMACTSLGSGETEDYLIYINPAPVCSGAPAAGTLSAQNPDICLGERVSLRADGATYGAGITYEWEESDDDGVTDAWTTATGTGADSPELTVSGLTDTIYYRFKVVCNNTLDSVYSTSYAINVKPFYMCYCNTGLGGESCNPSTAYISNVSVTGSLLNNTSSCSGNRESYSYFGFTAGANDTFDIDEMINLSVTNTETANKVAVWIDFDHNQVYDDTEFTLVTAASVANVPTLKNIVIPSSALTGFTGMRIRAVGLGERLNDVDACSNFGSGETEDYVIYIQPAPACAGIPVAGTVPAHLSVCSGEGLMVETTGASYGPGISYQWEVSADAGVTDPWIDAIFGGGTNTRQFKTPALLDTVYYRLRINCFNSGITQYSDTVEVTIKSFFNCYCNSDLGAGNTCAFGEFISNVSIIGGNLNNSSTCVSTGANNNYASYLPAGFATDTVTTGDFVDLSVTYAGSNTKIAAWIDYDHSGTFDAAEYTLIATNTNGSSTQIKTIEIPATALEGQTGIRIRTNDPFSPLDPVDACTNFLIGETEDYIIMINQAPACSGMPTAGTVPSSYLICPGKPFDITTAGATFNSGITYQWEESDDNGTSDPWADVTGAQSRTLSVISGITAEKYYRLKAICTNTMDSTYTNVMHMSADSFYNCYDAGTDLGGGSCFGSTITNVDIPNTPLDNASTCNVTSLGSRTSFPVTGSTTATLLAQTSYRVNVTVNSASSIGIWIDFDRNGTFDPLEFTLVTGFTWPGRISANIPVPTTAAVGLTGMRVRTNMPLMWGGTMAPNTAASFYSNGETEDYVITLDTLKPVTNVTATDIGNNDMTVRWTNGNGEARVVLAKEASTTLTEPVSGIDFFAPDPVFGSGFGDSTAIGNYIVFNSDRDTFVTVTGLNLLTQYEFYVYEYINTPTGTIYSLPGQATSGTTLPVNLLSFTASKKQQDVLLSWSTASELNNKGFAIERSNGNGKWEKIGFVNGKGTTNGISKYNHTDLSAFNSASTLYYRLRQEDFNGKATYSHVVKAGKDNISKTAVQLYPNPFEDAITLNIESEVSGDLHVVVKDLFGKTVAAQTVVTAKGNTVLTLDELSHLANGIYFLQVEQHGQVQNFKVTKAK
jgi:hypothetical protein